MQVSKSDVVTKSLNSNCTDKASAFGVKTLKFSILTAIFFNIFLDGNQAVTEKIMADEC